MLKTKTKRKINARIDNFIIRLSQLKYLKDIKECCQDEVEALRKEGYTITTLKDYLQRYREAAKALRSKKQRDQVNSIMRIEKQEKEALTFDYHSKVREFTFDAIKFPASKIDYFIDKAHYHLSKKTFAGAMMGLELLTGRRGVELLKKGHFYRLSEMNQAIDDTSKELPKFLINSPKEIQKRIDYFNFNPDKTLLFWGQAKANNESKTTATQPYPIPCLGDIDLIFEAFSWLRTNYPQYLEMDEREINIMTHGGLNDYNSGVKHPRNYGMDFEAQHCNFKVLRKVYAAINSYQLIGDEIEKDRVLYSLILGHAIASEGTAASYQYVRFVDR